MGLGHGAGIVRSGLVLYLDAANKKSYPGTGTTWTDMSGSGNNTTLVNGVGYTTTNKGTMTFDGVNDHSFPPTNFFPYSASSAFTINLWFKSTQTTGGTIFAQQSVNTPDSASSFVPVIYLRSNGTLRIEPFWTGSTTNVISSTNALNNGTWQNATITFGSNTNQLYVNGIFNSQRTGLTLASYTTIYYYIIGAGFMSSGREIGTNYFNGSISNFSFYNRVLSNLEIQKNFNTLRGRYGI